MSDTCGSGKEENEMEKKERRKKGRKGGKGAGERRGGRGAKATSTTLCDPPAIFSLRMAKVKVRCP